MQNQQKVITTESSATYLAQVVECLVREHGYTLAEANVFANMGKQGLLRYEEMAVQPSVIAKRLAAEIPQRKAA